MITRIFSAKELGCYLCNGILIVSTVPIGISCLVGVGSHLQMFSNEVLEHAVSMVINFRGNKVICEPGLENLYSMRIPFRQEFIISQKKLWEGGKYRILEEKNGSPYLSG